ncbi:CHAT domain-containing protein [Leptolyngbya sp. NIES-2104]|uniref:CHAT domain-containing protein n=1 Tax=Leptolyngbya sp. NIES-2104 TaxID=1552121 RepID=UPI0006EC7B35|nr:CHAT domain-containing protein [Leptolyngbya sp. NIES-2104]GAP94207.1 putative hemagglutinin-related protein [Leptolyngbya sp. NIES-2104]
MLRWLIIFLASLMIAISVPQLANSSQLLIQQGITQYDRENFSEAIQLWKQANQNFANQKNVLGQALTLNNLSLAYQQLGQLQLAEQSLNQSFHLLAQVSSSPEQSEVYAKALNAQGKLYWLHSQLELALTAWQKSAQGYAQANNSRGVAIAQLNQAKALQALGFSRQAESLLQQIYQQIQSQADIELKATVLRDLGSVLRQVGNLNRSGDRLQESLKLAKKPAKISSIYLELGNTERAIAERLQALGRSEARSHLRTALNYYEQSISLDHSLSAQLNRFALLVETAQSDKAIVQLPKLRQAIGQLPPSRITVYAAIHLSENWMRLAKSNSIEIAQFLSSAIKQAQQLNDSRAESYALGQLGNLYEQAHQWAEARSLTEKALLKLEPIRAPEIRYRWEWQLGRLAQYQNDRKVATSAYETAIASLQSIRNDLLRINPDVQFSFRDNVEPVYREFIQLLLTSEQQPSQTQLQKAIQSVDALQIAELENYLGCTLGNIKRVDQISDTNALILYPILLQASQPSERLAVIAQFPQASNQFVYYETTLAKGTAETTLQALQENLAIPGRTPEVLTSAKTVYDWMIKPLEPQLAGSSINTLVFVLDGALRNIPMSVLYDGKQHLIEKGYAVAIAPRLQVFTPRSSPEALAVTLGGVGIPQTIDGKNYPPILKLREELDRIAQSVKTNPPLINEAFTIPNIRKQLQNSNFSAIHWKTHGTFSSDPTETYMVAYKERIATQTLHDLVQISSRSGSRPLELLVLSACETARGDSRAVLGLAGLAARTGTRSVLSTLWTAQDAPNTEFMAQFYRSLSQPGTTKAEAVRQAQLNLIQKTGYTTPHIWSNYVLIGNWL